MPAKTTKTKPLVAEGAKIGEPVPRAIVDTNTASVGIPPQPEFDAEKEISAVRKQLETLRQQVADASGAVQGGARQAIRQTEATVKLYPLSSLIAVAATAALFAVAIAGLQGSPRRSRYDRALEELRAVYDSVRGRF
ncbi:hypothetical protein HJA95_14170 [Rhizobium binae]|uniref:hypothetical protein n=1 Tax=Rhizobium binae TaxID=1138190 RepID=UPI001C82CA63|nr:hypothetical protein [Rhizobium binae]MBX4950703.1 hypothetical protein [Rhizobium binae]